MNRPWVQRMPARISPLPESLGAAPNSLRPGSQLDKNVSIEDAGARSLISQQIREENGKCER
jgi:hypothetical protein